MISALYNRLTRPSDVILQPDKRRQVQLLASLILVLLGVLWVVEIASIIEYSADGDYNGYWLSVAFSLVLVGLYYLGRTRHFLIVVWLILGALTAQIIYLALFVDDQIYPNMMYFLLLPFLLGSFFFSERVTVLLFGVYTVFLSLLIIFLQSTLSREVIAGPLILFVSIGGLILVLMHYRNRMEEDRQQELARERNLLRTVIDNVPDQIFVRDRAGNFVLSNVSDARVMGVSDPILLVGKNDFDFYPDHLAARYQEDNRIVMESGQPMFNVEEPSSSEGGVRWVLTTKVPLRDINGEVIGLVGIARDITERKRSEVERRILEKQLAHAHKLEALGQLAAGLAHEISTPLQYVASNLRFARGQLSNLMASLTRVRTVREMIANCPTCAEILPQLEAIIPTAKFDYLADEFPLAIEQSLQGADRITQIVSAMRTFSHPGNDRRTIADIHHILENTLTVTHTHWKALAEVETHFSADLPAIPCFQAELGQVFLNIILNAVDAIAEAAGGCEDEKGKITITTMQAEGWVEIRIADNGCGIPEEIQEHIFDYFFTTKDVGKGSGQGLAICHNIIVKMHGGSIAVESQAGAGTTFIIRLPSEESKPGVGQE